LWISVFQAIDELVCSKNPNWPFYFKDLRSWGWNLTIVGGQPETPIVSSIVYGQDYEEISSKLMGDVGVSGEKLTLH
jgi:hypothetical protein